MPGSNGSRVCRSDERTSQYFTPFYGILDVRTLSFRYVPAGHPPALHCRAGAAPRILETAGFPIGVVPRPEYSEVELELRKGDRLFILSDGILEAEDLDRNHFGLSGLAAVLDAARDRTLDEAVMAVGARLEAWCAGRGLSDDASMVAFEVLPDEREDQR